MDPQQRISMHLAWQVGHFEGRVATGEDTGVFVGQCNNGWGPLDHSSVSPFTATGRALCVSANRIAFVLALSGPSMVIDTACSSSLVAVGLVDAEIR